MAGKSREGRLSHIFIRVITALTITNFLFFQVGENHILLDHHSLGYRITIDWTELSIVLLPLYVLAERWRMRNSEMEMMPLLIDAGFVLLWIVFLVGVVLYTLAHHAIL